MLREAFFHPPVHQIQHPGGIDKVRIPGKWKESGMWKL